MQDEPFERPLQEAARAYHEPPVLDDAMREAMWTEIEAGEIALPVAPRMRRVPRWVGLAAAVVLGIGLGRFTPIDGLLHPRVAAPAPGTVATTAVPRLPVPAVYEPTTSQYLGQTTALLVALPSEVRDGRADVLFINRAQNLLLTTRLLLDSPASQDAKLRGLLDDLEVVLAQVVRLRATSTATDLDLINQALEQRDVLPRLRTAAADISAD